MAKSSEFPIPITWIYDFTVDSWTFRRLVFRKLGLHLPLFAKLLLIEHGQFGNTFVTPNLITPIWMRLKICGKKMWEHQAKFASHEPIEKNVCQTLYVPILAFLGKSDIFKYKIGHHNTTQPPGNLPERCRAKGMAVLLGQPRSGELPWESSVSKLKQKQKETEQRTAEPRNAAGPMEDMYSSQPLENRDKTWKITLQTLHLAFRFHLFSMFILLFKAFRAMKHFFQSPGLRTAHSRRSQWLNSPMGPISKVGKFWSTSSSKTKLERISWTTFGGCFVFHVCSSVVLYSPTTSVQKKQHNIHFVS